MTKEEVITIERTMSAMGIDKYSRPTKWACRPPAWYTECRERKDNEDPLAVVEIVIEGDSVSVDSSYRFTETGYAKISPDDMNAILTAMCLWKNKTPQSSSLNGTNADD